MNWKSIIAGILVYVVLAIVFQFLAIENRLTDLNLYLTLMVILPGLVAGFAASFLLKAQFRENFVHGLVSGIIGSVLTHFIIFQYLYPLLGIRVAYMTGVVILFLTYEWMAALADAFIGILASLVGALIGSRLGKTEQARTI